MTLAKAVSMKYNKTIEKCSNEEIYYALLDMTKQMAEDKVSNEGKEEAVLHLSRVLNRKAFIQQPDQPWHL